MTFAADLKLFEQKTGRKGKLVADRITLMGLSGVTLRSPVRYGTFRASWNVGIGGPDTRLAPERTEFAGPAGGSAATGDELLEAEESLRDARWEDDRHVTNAQPYGQALEDGSSAQTEHQPDGILGATVDELERHARSVIESVARA